MDFQLGRPDSNYFLFSGIGSFPFKRKCSGNNYGGTGFAGFTFAYGMPTDMAFASVIYGFFYGLWPISWIIIGAVFLYKVSVKQASSI